MIKLSFILGCSLFAASTLFAQPNYNTEIATGQLILTRTANLLQLSQSSSKGTASAEDLQSGSRMMFNAGGSKLGLSMALAAQATAATSPSLPVTSTFNGSGFLGLTHRDQRLSNNGNQFSIEPPSPSLAVANGSVLEGVNNAVQVFTTSGTPLLAQAVSTNILFGLPPACITDFTKTPPECGAPFGTSPTDMRVFYDQGIDRWFVVQRAIDLDSSRNSLNRSHIYMAVSQTGDPIGNYNIYWMETTNPTNRGCPCFSDYPQVGADQYGFHISSNEYSLLFNQFIDVAILSISKASLVSGASLPTTVRTLVHQRTGYEATIHPATTPPGASYFVASNGLEYFISSSSANSGSTLAIWALTNTGSLATSNPSLTLSQAIIPTLSYAGADVVSQRPGPLTYGSTLKPPGLLARIDGGDARMQSVTYAGGRLYATLGTAVTDEDNHRLAGAAYFIITPTFRSGVLAAFALRQGYLQVRNNSLLRPSIAVNAQGKGAIAFTLLGLDYYPSAALIPIDTFTTGTAIQIAAPGVMPEDGFSGYPDIGFPTTGIARWGDYSGAVIGTDGAVWTVTEYIPNAPRTDFANWGTFLGTLSK